VLRIHFTADDLARVSIAAEPDPLWEVLLSLHMVQGGDGALMCGPWRRRTRDRFNGSDLRLLRDLAPPTGYSPDFLTPIDAGPALEPAIDRLLSTPRSRLRADLDYLATRQPPTIWTRALAHGEPAALTRLGSAVRSYHDIALAPYWRSIRRHVVTDRARRVEQLARHGVDHVLANLHPGVRWEPPVLQIFDFVDTDIHLGGRGLRLQPSFFCWQAPTKLRDITLAPVLVYPTQPPPGSLVRDGQPHTSSTLENLIGRTRALVLEATVAGCTTTELARICGISAGAASQHTAVLRNSALITTRRDGLAVIHEITSLGLALLDGATAA